MPDPPRSLDDLLEAETASTSLPALLRYEDRNSMAHSIEARVPFLDHRVVEYAFSLPEDWKLRGVTSKYALREALAGVIPERVRARPDKLGFKADPEITWAIAERHRHALLAARTPFEEAWFEPDAVASLLGSRSAAVSDEFLAWRVLSLKLWLRKFWGGRDSVFA